MSKPVVVFDDQEIACSEQSTPYVTDRRCWSRWNGVVGAECGGRLAYNSPADALLCPECGSVYNYRLELLGTSVSWDGEVDTVGEEDELVNHPYPTRPSYAPVPDILTDRLEAMMSAQAEADRTYWEEINEAMEVTYENASSSAPMGPSD